MTDNYVANFPCNSILVSPDPGGGFQTGSRALALCTDCSKTGHCALAHELSKLSVPIRNGKITDKNGFLNDMENWQPVNHEIKDLKINPYADNKLKHETCPFHRLRSVGLEINLTKLN